MYHPVPTIWSCKGESTGPREEPCVQCQEIRFPILALMPTKCMTLARSFNQSSFSIHRRSYFTLLIAAHMGVPPTYVPLLTVAAQYVHLLSGRVGKRQIPHLRVLICKPRDRTPSFLRFLPSPVTSEYACWTTSRVHPACDPKNQSSSNLLEGKDWVIYCHSSVAFSFNDQ